MEESIIYLPTQCEDYIAMSRVAYDTFLVDKKISELQDLFLQTSSNLFLQNKIFCSFEKFSYTVYLGKYRQKSYYLYNQFCFLKNYVCFRELSLEEQKMYLSILKEFLSFFSFEPIWIFSGKDYESHYPKCLVRQAFEVQKRIAGFNQFVLTLGKSF